MFSVRSCNFLSSNQWNFENTLPSDTLCIILHAMYEMVFLSYITSYELIKYAIASATALALPLANTVMSPFFVFHRHQHKRCKKSERLLASRESVNRTCYYHSAAMRLGRCWLAGPFLRCPFPHQRARSRWCSRGQKCVTRDGGPSQCQASGRRYSRNDQRGKNCWQGSTDSRPTWNWQDSCSHG